MATLLGGKIIDSSGTSPILGSASNLGTINKNALANSSAGINPAATPAAVLSSGLKFGQATPVANQAAPTVAKPAATVAPKAVTPTKTAAPVVTPTPTPTTAPTPTPTPMVDVYDKAGNKTSVSEKDFVSNPFYKNEGYTTTPPSTEAAPTQEKATATTQEADTGTKISSLLNQGYDSVDNIATATGMTVDEVNKYLEGDESASYKLNINKNTNQQDEAYKSYKASIDSITNGTFALTPSEQADIKAIQDSFDRLREKQIEANKNYEGTIQTGEIRSGRQEFMNQISSGIFKQAIDDGVQKVKDIESSAAQSIRDYKTAVETKNYKAASDAYTALQKYLGDKSTAIKELHTATVDEYKRQQDVIKAASDAVTASLNQQKLGQDIATSTAESLTPALAGASDEVIQDLAKYYNIDPNILTSSVIKTSQDFEKDMINKGYRTINPADVEKMRSQGAEVVTYSGRAYMKEPELKSFTNKGNVDFYKGTQKVGSSKLTGGSGIVGGSSAGFDAKISKSQLNTFLSSVKGADLKVSPQDWLRAKDAWIQDGGSPSDFDTEFKGYQDPNNTYN